KKDLLVTYCSGTYAKCKTGQEHLIKNVLPLLVRAYDDNDVRIQEEVLKRTVSLAKQLDAKLVKQAILPRVHGLALKTTVAAVRVNALICLGDLVTTLDKHAVLDVLQTIQRCTAVDRSVPTLMCTLGVANSIFKQFGLEFVVDHVLPVLMPLLIVQQLNVQQFAKYMLFVKDILRKIEEKRGVTVTDSGTPEVRLTPVTNGIQSEPLRKTSGPVSSSTKSSPAWDEDWGPIKKGPVSSLPASGANQSSMQTKPVVQPVVATQSLSSLISSASSQQATSSCPPVDIEWPPRASSGSGPQSVESEKQKQNSDASSPSFDDIDPFADWPPRPNTSIGVSASANKSNTGMSSHNLGFNMNSHSNMNFGTSGNLVGQTNQYQGNSMLNSTYQNTGGFNNGISNPQSSLGSLRQSQGSLGSSIGTTSYTEKRATDLGSIFVSSKNEQTALRLAPPPSVAVGRGRGRGSQGQHGSTAASRSSRSKPPSEQPPLLDLL
ncbi:Scy1-like protein, partial [Thalictrum thalictroides]